MGKMWLKFYSWLLWLLGIRPLYVRNFEGKSMSKSIVLNWTDPPAPITGIEIAMRVQGAPDYTPLPVVAPGVHTLTVPDLVDGTYEFRAVSINGSKRSAGVFTSATVSTATPADVVPGDVTGFTATVV